MKNIRFYEAEKYNSDDYEKVEDMIYKTTDKKTYGESLALKGCSDTELVLKLLKSDDWAQGSGEFLEDYMILTYDGKRLDFRFWKSSINLQLIQITQKAVKKAINSCLFEVLKK